MRLKNLVEIIELGKACKGRDMCRECEYDCTTDCFYNYTKDIVEYLEILLSSEVYNPVKIVEKN